MSCESFAKNKLPSTVLWAWEARQDLRSLDPNKVGVAVYIGTVTLKPYGIRITPSRQLMAFPPAIYRMGVVHISILHHTQTQLDQAAVEKTVEAIMALFNQAGMNDLQLDFSATKSQQAFYAEVIRRVHKRLQRNTLLSVTALANWCVGDRWIAKYKLPIDLVVPMYFSLGPQIWQKQQFINHFPAQIHGLAPECRHAIGVATFETWQIPLRTAVPVFVFTRGTWNKESIHQAMLLSQRINNSI